LLPGVLSRGHKQNALAAPARIPTRASQRTRGQLRAVRIAASMLEKSCAGVTSS